HFARSSPARTAASVSGSLGSSVRSAACRSFVRLRLAAVTIAGWPAPGDGGLRSSLASAGLSSTELGGVVSVMPRFRTTAGTVIAIACRLRGGCVGDDAAGYVIRIGARRGSREGATSGSAVAGRRFSLRNPIGDLTIKYVPVAEQGHQQ